MTKDQVRTNERRVIGALLLRRITVREAVERVGPIHRLRDPLLASIGLTASCMSLLDAEPHVDGVAKCVRALGHEGPIEGEIEQLMQEGSNHVA